MKKALSALLVIVMVLSLMPMTVFAASNPTIYFETDFTTELAAGDTFTVTAHLKDNVRFDALTLTLKWNDKAVKFNGFATNNRGIPTSEVFNAGDGYTTAAVNQETGKIMGVDATGYGYDNNGMLFIANFEIVGEGALDIGLKTDDPTVFEMVDNNGVDQAPILDTSALNGLTVGGKPVGPEMPENAPFTAITTDVGPIVDVEECGFLSVDPWGTGFGSPVAHYHITIPADATEAYVRFPLSVDNFVSQNFMIGENEIGSAYASVNHDDLDADAESGMAGLQYGENGDDYTVMIIPMEFVVGDMMGNVGTLPAVKGEDELYYAVGPQDNGGNTYALFSFEYAGEEEEIYSITIDEGIVGGTVWAENEDGETITQAKPGDVVVLQYEAEEGYAFVGFSYVNDDTNQATECANGAFDMPWSNVTIKAVFRSTHTCEFKEVVADKYLKEAATCEHAAEYFKSCECGKTSTETFFDGETVDHKYENSQCIWCQTAEVIGYTVTMGADVEAVAGETISIPVTVGYTDDTVKNYNAFDMTFTYDSAVLTLTSTAIEGMTVTDNSGTVHVQRYGSDLSVGGTALTLTFKATVADTTNVKVTAAKVGISETALTQEADDAAIIDDCTKITVTGYTVNLPAEFEGESTVAPGENYTFEAKDKNYNYDVTAKIGDDEIDVTDNGDGTFTIPAAQITGNIVITTEKTGKLFDVTLGDDMTGETSAQYMTPYTATLTKEAGYGYQITVTIGGEAYTGFTYDAATGVVTIPGQAIVGAIVFDSGKEAGDFTVAVEGNHAGDVTYEATAEGGKPYSFKLNKVDGYTYEITATMGGEKVELTEAEGTYTIAKVTGNIVITVEGTSDLKAEVKEYVTLNGKTMFLVTATQTLADDEALSYDGNVMFWSEQYAAWAYLVITDGALTDVDAAAKITSGEVEFTELKQTYDVNEAGKVDINDAQLVFDMYNNEYQDFTSATMLKFLKADVNGDKSINVHDAAAIVAEIVRTK